MGAEHEKVKVSGRIQDNSDSELDRLPQDAQGEL